MDGVAIRIQLGHLESRSRSGDRWRLLGMGTGVSGSPGTIPAPSLWSWCNCASAGSAVQDAAERLARNQPLSIAPDSSPSTPPSTCTRWLWRGSASRSKHAAGARRSWDRTRRTPPAPGARAPPPSHTSRRAPGSRTGCNRPGDGSPIVCPALPHRDDFCVRASGRIRRCLVPATRRPGGLSASTTSAPTGISSSSAAHARPAPVRGAIRYCRHGMVRDGLSIAG